MVTVSAKLPAIALPYCAAVMVPVIIIVWSVFLGMVAVWGE